MNGTKFDKDKLQLELLALNFIDWLECQKVDMTFQARLVLEWMDCFFFRGGDINDLKECLNILLEMEADIDAQIINALEFGAEKYAAWNYTQGLKYSRTLGAFRRHIWGWLKGENDPETGLSHLAHAACNVLFLVEYEKRELNECDDRPLNSESSNTGPEPLTFDNVRILGRLDLSEEERDISLGSTWEL